MSEKMAEHSIVPARVPEDTGDFVRLFVIAAPEYAPALFTGTHEKVTRNCFRALKTIDSSITYAIWAGLGLALIAAIGILYFKEPLSVQRMVFIGFIPVGVIGLSLSGVRG